MQSNEKGYQQLQEAVAVILERDDNGLGKDCGSVDREKGRE